MSVEFSMDWMGLEVVVRGEMNPPKVDSSYPYLTDVKVYECGRLVHLSEVQLQDLLNKQYAKERILVIYHEFNW